MARCRTAGRRAALPLLGMALAAIAPGASAGAADAPGELWRRAVSPDGMVAVSIPCSASETAMRRTEATTAMICKSGGLGFEVLVGAMPGRAQGAPAASFDTLLAEATRDKAAGTVAMVTIGGHRAFTVTRPASGPLGLAEFVDFKPQKPVVLMAMEDPEGAIGAAAREAATARARKFIASLEILGS